MSGGDRPIALLVLLPVTGVVIARTMPRMLRLNIRDPRLVLVVPSQWCMAFRAHEEQAEALLSHELSHLRHRDALRRRLLAPYRNFAPLLAFLDTGVVFTVRISAGWQLALLAVAAVAGVTSVRRAYREIAAVQEMRADAEAAPDPEWARTLAAAVEALPTLAGSPVRKRRLTALRAGRAMVRRSWLIVVLGAAGFVAPLLVLAALVLTGVAPPDLAAILD